MQIYNIFRKIMHYLQILIVILQHIHKIHRKNINYHNGEYRNFKN